MDHNYNSIEEQDKDHTGLFLFITYGGIVFIVTILMLF